MATANKPSRDHKLLIIRLYKQGYSEEKIAEQLCNAGVYTTFLEVLQHLETAGVIPCPSPTHSKDEDNATRRCHTARLGVTCHHGESFHISRTNLANIPSDPTPIETYQQDIQAHEEFACGYRQPPVEPVELGNGTTPLVIDSDSEDEKLDFEDEYLSTWMKQRPRGRRDSDLRAWLKRSQQLKRDRKQMDGSLKRLERKTKFRGGKRDQK